MKYLAIRLDSFSGWEAAQFQTMAGKLAIKEMTDFIDPAFCRQKSTVIILFMKNVWPVTVLPVMVY